MTWLLGLGGKMLAILGLIGIIVTGWLYVGHLRSEIKNLEIAQQQAVQASEHSSASLAQALGDFKRQSQILVKQKARAVAEAKQLADRYHQIMEATDESLVSPVLCSSLIRVREPPAISGGSELSVPHPARADAAGGVAEPACRNLKQKDIAAWIETQVYPGFKAMQQQMIDLGQYTGAVNP